MFLISISHMGSLSPTPSVRRGGYSQASKQAKDKIPDSRSPGTRSYARAPELRLVVNIMVVLVVLVSDAVGDVVCGVGTM
jgi:hypothetical protein